MSSCHISELPLASYCCFSRFAVVTHSVHPESHRCCRTQHSLNIPWSICFASHLCGAVSSWTKVQHQMTYLVTSRGGAMCFKYLTFECWTISKNMRECDRNNEVASKSILDGFWLKSLCVFSLLVLGEHLVTNSYCNVSVTQARTEGPAPKEDCHQTAENPKTSASKTFTLYNALCRSHGVSITSEVNETQWIHGELVVLRNSLSSAPQELLLL